MSATQSIGALVPWYGSKRRMAPRLVEMLGTHRHYVEPFCGSMAVLLAKPAVANELVNDLHGDLVNLARVVSDGIALDELTWHLDGIVPAEAVHADACTRLAEGDTPSCDGDCPDVRRAGDYFVAMWLGRNGLAGTERELHGGMGVRFGDNGGAPAVRFRSAVQSLRAFHVRLKSVVITNRNGFDVLRSVPDATGTAIYVDPPYLHKQATYRHDFRASEDSGLFAPGERGSGADDHDVLAALLRRFTKAQVVVSYYADPRLETLYPASEGWRIVDVPMGKAMSNASGSASEAPEVLIVND